MSEAGGPCRGPSADDLKAKNTIPAIAVQAREDVLIVKYGKGYRWWPSPESRKKGSQRWAVPAVEQWRPAASIAEIAASLMAPETT
jgi:hypothetical protein